LKKFSLLFFIGFFIVVICKSQQSDSSGLMAGDTLSVKDTVSASTKPDTVRFDSAIASIAKKNRGVNQFEKVMSQNRWLSADKTPVPAYQSDRYPENHNVFFYVITFFFFFLGILKIAFGKYFSNMFRVFFNTSLRQSQLTDQLLQDKLPSMLFNLFFVMVGGVYIYLLLLFYQKIHFDEYQYLYYAMLTIALVYFCKFIVLQLIGWLSGFRRDTEIYTFIVFLINKILGILLLPCIAFIAFADKSIQELVILISGLLIGFMFVLRYLRGFSSIQQSLKISKFHFLLYIITVELLPIFLICQIAWKILIKSL